TPIHDCADRRDQRAGQMVEVDVVDIRAALNSADDCRGGAPVQLEWQHSAHRATRLLPDSGEEVLDGVRAVEPAAFHEALAPYRSAVQRAADIHATFPERRP